MSVNVVNYGDTTLIDISDSTVTEETLIAGETAYAANGDKIVGTLELARVAITGSYDDLKNKPNPVLTINNVSPDESGNIEVTGADGKSAYDLAVEAGYEGTEAEFSAQMAKIASLDIFEGETIIIWDGTGAQINPISNFNLSDDLVPTTLDGLTFYAKEE